MSLALPNSIIIKMLDPTEKMRKKPAPNTNFLKASESTTNAAKKKKIGFQHIGDPRKDVTIIGASMVKDPTSKHLKSKQIMEQQQ